MKVQIPVALLLILLAATLYADNSFEIADLKFSPFVHYESSVINETTITTKNEDFIHNRFFIPDISVLGTKISRSNFFTSVNFTAPLKDNSKLLPFYLDWTLGYNLKPYSLYCGRIFNFRSQDTETLESLYISIDRTFGFDKLQLECAAQYLNGKYTKHQGGTEIVDVTSLNLLFAYQYNYLIPYGLFSLSKWNIENDLQYQLSLGLALFNLPDSRNFIRPATSYVDDSWYE